MKSNTGTMGCVIREDDFGVDSDNDPLDKVFFDQSYLDEGGVNDDGLLTIND